MIHKVTSLQECGYATIKTFFSQNEIDWFLNSYDLLSKEVFENGNYNILTATSPKWIKYRLLPILKAIQAQTKIKADSFLSYHDFWDNRYVRLNWHQDAETWYTWQQAFHTVNFWIPLIKPIAFSSGLELISHSTLKSQIPDIWQQKIFDQSARRFQQNENSCIMIDDNDGSCTQLPIILDKSSIVPKVEVGDILLLRGDTIHRSQPPIEQRISVSIRAIFGNHILYKDKFYGGCERKVNMINKNPKCYEKHHSLFDNNEAILASQLL